MKFPLTYHFQSDSILISITFGSLFIDKFKFGFLLSSSVAKTENKILG